MAGKQALEQEARSDEASARVARRGGAPPAAPPDDDPTVAKPGLHPAAAPAIVTLVAVVLVVGIGWLNRSGEPGPAALARPLANGESSADGGTVGDAASVREVTPSGVTSDTGVVTTRGSTAVLLPTWMDIPLVAPAIAVRPEAVQALIPGAEPTTVPPSSGSGSGTGSGAGGTTAPTASGPTVTQPGTLPTATTQPAVTVPPTSAPPTTEPPPPTTEPPTTAPPTTEPPTTELPPTTDLPPPTDTGLLDVVDDLLGDVTGLLVPPT